MFKYDAPLGLPQGSVRALITLLLLGASIALHVLGKTSIELDSLAAGAVGYYLGVRGAESSQVATLTPATPEPITPSFQLEDEDTDTEQTIVPGEHI